MPTQRQFRVRIHVAVAAGYVLPVFMPFVGFLLARAWRSPARRQPS